MYNKQLRYVITVAKEGSFSRAADILNIAQPSLSQYIKKIEKQLGIELFDRNSNSVRLTDAGQVYIEHGRKFLEIERQMESCFQDILQSRYGTIRIGISAHRCVCLMPPIIKAFREEYPGIVVVLNEQAHGALMDSAEHGEFDLCVTTLPVDRKLFEVEPLFREELVLAVPSDSDMCRTLHKAEEDGKIDISILDNYDFVMLNEDHLMQQQLNMLISDYDLHLNKAVECTSLEALTAMVSVGVGVGLIPIHLRNFASHNITCFRFKQVVNHRDVVMIYRKDLHLSKVVLAFKEHIKNMLK